MSDDVFARLVEGAARDPAFRRVFTTVLASYRLTTEERERILGALGAAMLEPDAPVPPGLTIPVGRAQDVRRG